MCRVSPATKAYKQHNYGLDWLALSKNFIKKECFKPNLKIREYVCLLYQEWKIVP